MTTQVQIENLGPKKVQVRTQYRTEKGEWVWGNDPSETLEDGDFSDITNIWTGRRLVIEEIE